MGRHDIQHNDTQHNNIQHNVNQYYNTVSSGIMINIVMSMLCVVMLSVAIYNLLC
jgi:hypothetical protein